MGTFKHNKKRNTGLVYEFLVRHLSQSMIDKNAQMYQKTLGVVRKYYGEGSILAEEHELFSVIQNTRGVSENAARRILGEVQRQAGRIDHKRLEIKKSNLIKEINHGFGQNFWDLHRIPEYRLLATIQMVIEAARSNKMLSESVQNIQLEEGLVNYMTSTNKFSPPVPPREEIDQLVMAITAKKFQEKYSKHLNKNQQVLLEKYMRFQVDGDEKKFGEYLNKRKSDMTETLNRYATMKEFVQDPGMMSRMNEAMKKFNSLPIGTNDEFISEMMLFENLVEEVESDG